MTQIVSTAQGSENSFISSHHLKMSPMELTLRAPVKVQNKRPRAGRHDPFVPGSKLRLFPSDRGWSSTQ